jgi:hypothetical protein
VLAFVLGGAGCPADGVVKTPELAACAGVEVAHAAYDYVGLVVEIEAVGN